VVQIHSPRPNYLESTPYSFSNSRKSAMSAWYEAKRSCLIPARRERSLSFELIVLRQESCFTGNPILGRLGTRSALWEERPKSSSLSPCRKMRSCCCVDCGQSSEKMSTTASARGEGASLCTRTDPGGLPSSVPSFARNWRQAAVELLTCQNRTSGPG
jgi:hypothetical protein